MSQDGGEAQLSFQGKGFTVPPRQSWLTVCQQQKQTEILGQLRTDGEAVWNTQVLAQGSYYSYHCHLSSAPFFPARPN